MKLVLDKLEKTVLAIVAFLFAVMVLALFYQIIMRFVFERANVWSEELTRYSFIWMSMLGSSVATRRSKNMDVDFFVNLMPRKLQKVNSIFTTVLIILFLLVIIIFGVSLVIMTHKQLSAGMQIPMSYMYASVPTGGLLILIFTIETIIDDLKSNNVEEG
ncbi:MAG: TRAP transporter small permease [Tissierellia bacterium]|nr:TRAP transporter small permease [Tissierellia bacterium]